MVDMIKFQKKIILFSFFCIFKQFNFLKFEKKKINQSLKNNFYNYLLQIIQVYCPLLIIKTNLKHSFFVLFFY